MPACLQAGTVSGPFSSRKMSKGKFSQAFINNVNAAAVLQQTLRSSATDILPFNRRKPRDGVDERIDEHDFSAVPELKPDLPRSKIE